MGVVKKITDFLGNVTGRRFHCAMPMNVNGRRGEKFLRGDGGDLEAKSLENFLEMSSEIFQAEP